MFHLTWILISFMLWGEWATEMVLRFTLLFVRILPSCLKFDLTLASFLNDGYPLLDLHVLWLLAPHHGLPSHLNTVIYSFISGSIQFSCVYSTPCSGLWVPTHCSCFYLDVVIRFLSSRSVFAARFSFALTQCSHHLTSLDAPVANFNLLLGTVL